MLLLDSYFNRYVNLWYVFSPLNNIIIILLVIVMDYFVSLIEKLMNQ